MNFDKKEDKTNKDYQLYEFMPEQPLELWHHCVFNKRSDSLLTTQIMEARYNKYVKSYVYNAHYNRYINGVYEWAPEGNIMKTRIATYSYHHIMFNKQCRNIWNSADLLEVTNRKINRNLNQSYQEEPPSDITQHYFLNERSEYFLVEQILEEKYNEHWKYEYFVRYEEYASRVYERVPRTNIMRSGVDMSIKRWKNYKPNYNNMMKTKYDDRTITLSQNETHGGINNMIKDWAEVDTGIPSLVSKYKNILKKKCINKIKIGRYEMNTCYLSPYPDDFLGQEIIWICDFCLKYYKFDNIPSCLCILKEPPGNKIYTKGTVGIWEVDGYKYKKYCQNICLLAKFFIEHKAVYFGLEPFLFYILCEVDIEGAHYIGYFSKLKGSPNQCNLSCILILPCYRRKGYGNLLISLSYELSKLEKKIGRPERPITKLAMISYQSYWSWILLDILSNFRGTITIKQLSEMTSISQQDIIYALKRMNMLKCYNGQYDVNLTPEILEKNIESALNKKPKCNIDSTLLTWQPAVVKNPRK